MTDAVGERVLRGSYCQTQALSLALAQAPAMVDVHDRMMRRLEQDRAGSTGPGGAPRRRGGRRAPRRAHGR
jgi:glutamate dehydrogenase